MTARQPAQDDIPCTTYEIYIAMGSQTKFIVKD
jgi:hypothetical protein